MSVEEIGHERYAGKPKARGSQQDNEDSRGHAQEAEFGGRRVDTPQYPPREPHTTRLTAIGLRVIPRFPHRFGGHFTDTRATHGLSPDSFGGAAQQQVADREESDPGSYQCADDRENDEHDP